MIFIAYFQLQQHARMGHPHNFSKPDFCFFFTCLWGSYLPVQKREKWTEGFKNNPSVPFSSSAAKRASGAEGANCCALLCVKLLTI